jgi:hypothetical protein
MAEDIRIADLTAQLDQERPGTLAVRFFGRSASREAGVALAPLFDRILAEARAEGLVLALHFEGLEYFNSSTIAALVQFLRAAYDAGIALTIVYDGKQKWQALSFEALRRALRPLDAGGRVAVEFSAL